MRFWSNLVGYQLVWFCAVIGAGRGLTWPGVVAALAFVAWQLAISDDRRAELRLLAAAVAMGVVLDGVLAFSGWGTYAAAWPSERMAPLWILALWSAFALTINHSMGFLKRSIWLAIAFGAIGGPLSYLGASRGFDALVLAEPDWRAIAWLAVAWGVALPLLAALARRGERTGTTNPLALNEGAR